MASLRTGRRSSRGVGVEELPDDVPLLFTELVDDRPVEQVFLGEGNLVVEVVTGQGSHVARDAAVDLPLLDLVDLEERLFERAVVGVQFGRNKKLVALREPGE